MKHTTRLLVLALGLTAGGCTATVPEGDLQLTRAWTGFRTAQSFVRLSEYSTGREDFGNAVVVRTHPEVREGFYFSVRMTTRERGEALPDGTLVLHVVAPDAAAPTTWSLPFSAEARRSVLLLVGLTGDDWTHGDTLPLAWKIDVVDGTGRVRASQQSYLWEREARK